MLFFFPLGTGENKTLLCLYLHNKHWRADQQQQQQKEKARPKPCSLNTTLYSEQRANQSIFVCTPH